MVSGGAMLYKAIKQKKIATSTQVAELNAVWKTAKSAIYVKSLLTDFFTDCPLSDTENLSMVVYCDNQRAIAWLNDMGRHARIKHYNIELGWL